MLGLNCPPNIESLKFLEDRFCADMSSFCCLQFARGKSLRGSGQTSPDNDNKRCLIFNELKSSLANGEFLLREDFLSLFSKLGSLQLIFRTLGCRLSVVRLLESG